MSQPSDLQICQMPILSWSNTRPRPLGPPTVMAVLAVTAAVVAALLTAVLLIFVVFSVYLVTAHRRYAHIPQPKGASWVNNLCWWWLNAGSQRFFNFVYYVLLSFFFGHLPVLRREGKKKFSFDLWNEWFAVWLSHTHCVLWAVILRDLPWHFVDYRFVDLRFVYKLNTKTSYSWLTKPKTF